MNSVFESFFPRERFGEPYESQEDYIADLVKKTELSLLFYLQSYGGEVSTLDRFRGVIITEEQVKQTLHRTDDVRDRFGVVDQQRRKADFVIESRKEVTEQFYTIDYLFDIYRLDELEQFYFLLCLMPHFDAKYERVFGYLQDDVTGKYPTCELALRLFYFVDSNAKVPNAQSMQHTMRQKFRLLCFDGQEGALDPQLAGFVLLGNAHVQSIPNVTLVLPQARAVALPAMGELADCMVSTISEYDESDTLIFYLHGVKGAGKRTLIDLTAQQLNMAILHASLYEMTEPSNKELDVWLLSVCRQALLQRAFLCFEGLPNDEVDPLVQRRLSHILSIAQQFCSVIFVSSEWEKHLDVQLSKTVWLDVPVVGPDKEQSIALWTYYMKDLPFVESMEPSEMANKFRFAPGQIAGTAQTAKNRLLWGTQLLDRNMFNSCAYEQVVHNLGQQATLLHAAYSMDDLILAEAEKEMLENACDQIRYKHIVYDRWGFNRRLTYGRGVSMLFAGPPGTGKTMAAQVVAKELGIEIYKVDLSQIVSKYIGETEKNLNLLFQEAQKSNVILFFDETDALLGKRTEVKDAHDKNANLETSFLLQKMEEYDGITIMTTNYLENIDSAFFRRISYVIHFPFPDETSRRKLWQTIFPKEMPKSDDIDYPYLAKQFEIAGGNIKNTAVTAAFLAAKQNTLLEMEHIIQALKYEMTKQGKIMLSEDFGEYSYLVN